MRARGLVIGIFCLQVFLVFLWSAEAFAYDRHVKIINNTSYVMERFYASRSNLDKWQEDIFGRRVLQPGHTVRVNIDDGSGACLYDFRAIMSDGQEITKYRVNVCDVTSWEVYD